MSPILGIYASQISGHLAPPDTGAYFPLGAVTIPSTGTFTEITFTSIPSTYTHLQVRMIGKIKDAGAGFANCGYQFNGDTNNSNYSFHLLKGDGSSATSTGAANYGTANFYVTSASPANVFTIGVTDILDYSNVNKYKTVRTFTGTDTNGAGEMYLTSTSWRSFSAISSFSINVGSPGWAQYTQFALYGIKGA